MNWILITDQGITPYRTAAVACTAVGVDVDSDSMEGSQPYLLEFRR